MKTLLTILFIGVISVKGQDIIYSRNQKTGVVKAVKMPVIDSIPFHFTYTHDCECCSEWVKQIGQKTVLIYSYKPLLDYYAKDSATASAIKDDIQKIQREIDELLKKAINCR